MHRGHALTLDAGPSAPAQQAAHWMVLKHAGALDAEQQRALSRWRASSPEHERAWRAAQELEQLFARAPAGLGAETLRRADHARKGRRAMLGFAASTPLAWWLWQTTGREWAADLRTAVGECRLETLADGSRVWLNTGSALNVRFGAEYRMLELLAGEILVETAKPHDDALPPLRVRVAGGLIQSLGTRFLVRGLDADRWRVAVFESAVRVLPRRAGLEAAVQVPQGMQTVLSAGGASALQPVDENLSSWRDGVIVARNMRLGELAAEIARYRRGVLRCAPEVAELRISGVFQLADTDRTLRALTESLPIAVRQRTRFWVTLTSA